MKHGTAHVFSLIAAFTFLSGCGGGGAASEAQRSIMASYYPTGSEPEGTWDIDHVAMGVNSGGVYTSYTVVFGQPISGPAGTTGTVPLADHGAGLPSQVEIQAGAGSPKTIYRLNSGSLTYRIGEGNMLYAHASNVVATQVAPVAGSPGAYPDFDVNCSALIGSQARYLESAKLSLTGSIPNGFGATLLDDTLVFGPNSGVTTVNDIQGNLHQTYANGTLYLDLRESGHPETAFVQLGFNFKQPNLPTVTHVLTEAELLAMTFSFEGPNVAVGGNNPTELTGKVTITPDGTFIFDSLKFNGGYNTWFALNGRIKVGNATRVFYDPFTAPSL